MSEENRVETATPGESALAKPKAGWMLKIATALAALMNMALGTLLGAGQAHDAATLAGIAVGGGVVAPAIVVLLFQAVPRFRNGRARAWIFFWASLLLLLAGVGQLGSMRLQG